MKKIILTSFMLCSVFAFSQEIKFGAKVGLNLSNLMGNYPTAIEETKSILGFHLGGFALYSINEKFIFQPELLLSTQGGSAIVYFYDTGRQFASFTQTPKLTYINLPIMFKYKVLNKLSVEFGPQVGYLINAKSLWRLENFAEPEENETLEIDLLNDGTYKLGTATLQLKPKTNRFDYGLNIGTSYEITEKIIIQARYNFGLSVIDDNSTNGNDTSSWKVKNSVIQISTGYKF
jgi:long-subunit fatty acid transport protein